MELQTRVIELVEKVLTLKGHADARAHEHFKYARDTLDDSLLQVGERYMLYRSLSS